MAFSPPPIPQALTDIMSKNISFFLLYVYNFFSNIISPLHKNLYFSSGQGFPPPLADMSAKNISYFYKALLKEKE